jgi:type IV pilus assembly protein PilE
MDNRGGFTLIELMIVVAIISILGAISVPNYTHYVYRSRQLEAKTLLMTLKTEEEQWLTENQTYTTTLSNLVDSNQMSANAKWYYLTIPTADSTSFTAQARGFVAAGRSSDVWFVTQASFYTSHDPKQHGNGMVRGDS